MEIRIFGPGCARCHLLEERTRETLDKLGCDAAIVVVTDIKEMAAAGVLRTPAMQIDRHFVLQGRVPGLQELSTMISRAFAGPAVAG